MIKTVKVIKTGELKAKVAAQGHRRDGRRQGGDRSGRRFGQRVNEDTRSWQPTPPAQQLAKSGKFGDLRRRLTFLLLALVVYRLGAHIPVPGIDPEQLRQLFNSQSGGILNLFNMFSGGALSRFTVFALGIMPYISASIIMQLMTYVVPSLEALKKEGESGRRKITQYTRYGTLLLAIVPVGAALPRPSQQSPGLVIDPGLRLRLHGRA